jgi:FlaA1/EpsC-like NDP-sugar epimerase
VAIIDDKSGLHGKRVHGLEVFSPKRLEELIESTGATGVLLAVPSASRHRRRQILERLSNYSVHVRTIPEVSDLISGKARVDDITEVDVKDLLGRDPVPPNKKLLRGSVSNKNVLVTGAGGSIGSELCRQIVRLGPKRLVCFEISESSLYSIDREIRQMLEADNLDCEVVALLGSAHHEARVQEALEAFSIDTVYHAAAYKHVPIVEHNIFEGIHNNVFGTLHTARAAINAGVEKFVLISTDKAVNPTSVMGATKRLSEQVLQAYNSRAKKTRFCMVRFGNVLESSGSVVPLFREQIRSGGPVTVTHRDIIRYFMTIPEAAQLVIQAGSMAKGGDVFVLDMGKPVRIEDLARRMIHLMGLTVRDEDTPDGDIEIQYIGLRPAEKLYEELLIGSNVSGTEHPRIMRADEDFLPYEELDGILGDLKKASAGLDYSAARQTLLRAVVEYAPHNGIDDLVWLQKTGTAPEIPAKTVVEFPKKEV